MKIQNLLLAALFLTAAACGNPQRNTIVQGRMGNANTLKEKTEGLAVEEEIGTEEEEEGLSGLYLLKKIDTADKTVSLVKAGNNRQVQYSFDTVTMFMDKYGNSKSQTSFISGEAVEIQVESKTNKLQKLWVTDRVWVQERQDILTTRTFLFFPRILPWGLTLLRRKMKSGRWAWIKKSYP